MSERRWRLVAGAASVFVVAAVAVAGLQRSAPAAHAIKHVAKQPARVAVGGDPDAKAGQHGVEESVGDPLSGYAGWFYGQRMAPAKTLPVGAYQAALAQAKALRANAGKLRAHGAVSAAAWNNLGPAPIDGENPAYSDPVWSNYGAGIGISTGRITALAVDPSDPSGNTVYIGGANGGIWKTTDGGTSWASVSDSLPTQSIGSLAIAPASPHIIYAGTGEANTNADSYYGYGVFRSGNGGASWHKLGGTTFDRLTVFKVLTRGNGNLILVATNKGLYRSADGGSTWRLRLAPGDPNLFQSFVTDVVWDYDGHVVAAVGFRTGKTTNGLYQSSNAGKTWASLGSPSGFTPQNRIGRIALASTPATPGLLYAAVQDAVKFNTGGASVFDGVYKSTAGASGPWTEVESADQMAANQSSALTDEHVGGGYRPGIQAWYNLYVQIDPTDSDDVVVGLEEVWNSSDGGANWNVIGRYWDFCYTNPTSEPWCNQGATGLYPTTHPDQHAAGFAVVGGNPVLYAGNDGGVWRQEGPTFDNDSWSNENTNQSTTQCYTAAASADGTVICGLQDNGFVKYTGSDLWPEIAGGDGADGVIDPANSQNIIGSYVNMNIYRSNNGGATYETISPGDPFPRFISPIAIDPVNSSHIVTVGERVWQTHVGFATTSADWHSMHDFGFPHQGTAIAVKGKSVYAAWCGGCNPSSFASSSPFASGMASNVGGWHDLAAAGLPNRYVTQIVIDPANKLHIFVVESGFARNWIPNAGIGHVFESTDGGASFTDISGNLPDAPVSSAVLDGSNLIVGTDTGVYEQAGGGTWAPLGTGFPTVVVDDLTFVPGTDTLVAASHGRGVWELDLGA